MRTSAVRLLWIKMNGMQHNLIGQKGNCRRSPGLFFLKFWLGGIRWYKVRHTASNHKNVERSSCFVSSISLRLIISNNLTNYYQTISTYVQTNKLQKVPKMPNKSLQYFGTFHWTSCVSCSFLLALIYQDRHCKCPVEIRLIKIYALIIQAS